MFRSGFFKARYWAAAYFGLSGVIPPTPPTPVPIVAVSNLGSPADYEEYLGERRKEYALLTTQRELREIEQIVKIALDKLYAGR